MKKLAVPLFLAACLLLTACGKAPDEPAAPTAEPTAATAQNTAYGYGFGMTYTTSRPTECILTSTTTACYSG